MIVTSQKNPKSEAVKAEPDAELSEAATDEAHVDGADGVDNVDDEAAGAADEQPHEDDGEGGLLNRKQPESGRRKRPWKRYLRRSVMPLLFVVSLAVSGFLGWQQWQEHQVKLAGEQAQQAAIAYAQVLTSIDSNKVDENFRQVLDGATGEFKDMYTQSSVKLRQLLIDNKATAHGVVVDSAIQSGSTNKVVVLVFIDQTVTNTAAPDPRIDRSRIKMTMEKVDGRWRASKVQLL